ncbi:MAG: hypothetical protein WCP95_02150 [Actinomycetes bacterium]
MSGPDAATYELRIAGYLDDRWSSWFTDLAITRLSDGTSTLTGEVLDQAQLHGILAGLRDIGATLLSLRKVDGDLGRISPRSGVQAPGRAERPRGGC